MPAITQDLHAGTMSLTLSTEIPGRANTSTGKSELIHSAAKLASSVTDPRNVMADQQEVDLDSIIDRLLEVRGSRPGKQVQLLETEIRYLCTKAREIFISQPILLELEAPIKVR